MKINILGSEYTIKKVNKGEDEFMEQKSLWGYCNYITKEIVHLNIRTVNEYKTEPAETIKLLENETLRHEIIHAFLNESGLQDSSHVPTNGWANNEEMVDWFAIQLPKILDAFVMADCI